MTAATLNQPSIRRRQPEDLVVSRHVRLACTQLIRRLRRPGTVPERLTLPDGDLLLAPTAQPMTLTSGWRTRGRFRRHGLRLMPFPPIEIQITPWSDDASELRIIPYTRYAHRWGVHRERRYARLAHAAADRLVSLSDLGGPGPGTMR